MMKIIEKCPICQGNLWEDIDYQSYFCQSCGKKWTNHELLERRILSNEMEKQRVETIIRLGIIIPQEMH